MQPILTSLLKGSINWINLSFPLIHFFSKSIRQQKVIANYDFRPSDNEELELKRGDIVTVLEKKDPNWWMGEIIRGNQICRGLFPKTYVSAYTDWPRFSRTKWRRTKVQCLWRKGSSIENRESDSYYLCACVRRTTGKRFVWISSSIILK